MTKIKMKLIAVASFIFLLTTPIFAEEEKSPFRLQLTTDFAYYPASEMIPGGDHFSKINGPYSGVEFCTTLNAGYVINTPLGEHWLVKDSYVFLGAAFELTPVSVKPKLSIEFSPVPFLVFRAGGSVGFGFNYLGLEGVAEYNPKTREYDTLTGINHPYYDLWASGTFQFDTGALIPGDWSHIILLASYSTVYTGLAGLEKGDIFEWQCTKYKACGLAYEVQGIIAYQMPLALKFAGVMYKQCGYYDGTVYGYYDKTFDGAFPEISISPVLQFAFGKNDELTALFDFSSRRSFESEIKKESDILYTRTTGREWYFKRLAISWTHKLF